MLLSLKSTEIKSRVSNMAICISDKYVTWTMPHTTAVHLQPSTSELTLCHTAHVENSGVSQEAASALSPHAICCWVWWEATRGCELVWTVPRNLPLHKWKWGRGYVGYVWVGGVLMLKGLNPFVWSSFCKSIYDVLRFYSHQKASRFCT